MSHKSILDAVIYAMTKEVANGRPIVDTPRELAGEGPCPNCGSPIEISGNTFSERMPGGGKRAPGASAIIVCGGCEKVLISNTPGKFVVVPRAVARKLPRVTRKFIERSLELIRSIKRGVQ